jgi:hypothetical protein
MEHHCRYCFKFCKICEKETFHFRLEGEGCVVWLCRNYETHKKETYARTSVEQVWNPLP